MVYIKDKTGYAWDRTNTDQLPLTSLLRAAREITAEAIIESQDVAGQNISNCECCKSLWRLLARVGVWYGLFLSKITTNEGNLMRR